MVLITLSLVSLLCMFHASAAPLQAPRARRAISSNPGCLAPNTDISAAQVSLAAINTSDVVAVQPLLTAQLALSKASIIAQGLGGFPPANGTAPVTIDSNSQDLIVSGLETAQTALTDVQAQFGFNTNKTKLDLEQAGAFLGKALVSAQAINFKCLSGAGATVSRVAVGASGSAAEIFFTRTATVTVTVGPPGSAATPTVGPFTVPTFAPDSEA
ncbi:hypothetical protein B0H19DRAFT_1369007 [Mycena capillaripes]|nr:hypothetical protein B0H19DRAFT_1369007 [Mycena capillaripes]